MNDESKDGKEQSKMSLAARKAWETRRKRSGYVERPRSEEGPEVVVEQLKRRYRGKRSKDEPWKSGYRKGQLVLKDKHGNHRKSAVKIDEKMREYLEFLYGRKWFEEIVLRKLWNQAKQLAEREIWREAEKPMLVVGK